MDYYSIACEVLKQLSTVLSKESNTTITLSPTGNNCWTENGYSVEFVVVDIPDNLISVPYSKYANDRNGYYKVNRIRLGKTILDDTAKGFPFNENELKDLIKSKDRWAYYTN